MPDAITGTSPVTDTMPTTAPAAAAATTNSDTPPATTSPSNKADSDMFLKLLVAQMRYQNPLEPMKGTEFIAQSAQLATVEALQAIQTAQTSAATWSKVQSAHGMMGLIVDAKDISGEAVTGQVLGVKTGLNDATLTLVDDQGRSFDVSIDTVTETRLPIAGSTQSNAAATSAAAARAAASTETA